MSLIGSSILKALIEGKWLDITYVNKQKETTRYWIAIKDIKPLNKMLIVEGFNIAKGPEAIELTIYFDSIKSAKVIDGTFYQPNERLLKDISVNFENYAFLTLTKVNLDILNYYSECNRLDTEPYVSETTLVKLLDDEEVTTEGYYYLSEEQFKGLVNFFQKEINLNQGFRRSIEICLNVLSIVSERGLYVLAHRRLFLDVKNKRLRAADEITLNGDFKIDGVVYRISQYLAEDDQYLLDDFENNKNNIADKIREYTDEDLIIDDKPNILHLEREILLDLNNEYQGIIKMFEEEEITEPIRAFFGKLKAPPQRRKNWPIVIVDKKVDIDQLLAIHRALKHPLTYIQGPPGSGKTKTIINTILSSFFNGRTVLVASANNHPLDGIYEKLRNLEHKGNKIWFPVIRLGNRAVVLNSLMEIQEMLEAVKNLKVFEKTLDKDKLKTEKRTKKITELLEKHERKLDLDERLDTASKMLENLDQPMFRINLEASQNTIRKELSETGVVSEQDIENVLEDFDEKDFYKYLYYTGARYIKRLNEPRYEEFHKIFDLEENDEKVTAFNRYLSNDDNLKLFMRAFPIIITTNISSNRLGSPKPHFDLTIIDEAGQCNPAASLLPIMRGKNLMLLGDPEQLKPVTVLDKSDNDKLKAKYKIGENYDYLTKSIYDVYELVDIITKPILLSSHYRCHKKIIDFNNQKFYRGRLKIKSDVQEERPLVFVDIKDPFSEHKNTSLSEAEEIVSYLKANQNRKVGIITPFVKQKELIEKVLRENGLYAQVGTIHAFQGDEKDVILFSSAITDNTYPGTYNWLKNNRELINVATSRAKEKLILYACEKRLLELAEKDDDFYDLYQYIKTNGKLQVKANESRSRALGFKPYSTKTEAEFLETLSHALAIVDANCIIREEVPVKKIVPQKFSDPLYYTGQYDFVIFRRNTNKPLIVFELDGPEHKTDEVVKARDRKKEEFLEACGLKLIRVPSSYARRYNYIKKELVEFFQK